MVLEVNFKILGTRKEEKRFHSTIGITKKVLSVFDE